MKICANPGCCRHPRIPSLTFVRQGLTIMADSPLQERTMSENAVDEKNIQEKPTRNPLRKLYNWVLSWAESRYGAWALFIIAFAESSFFPWLFCIWWVLPSLSDFKITFTCCRIFSSFGIQDRGIFCVFSNNFNKTGIKLLWKKACFILVDCWDTMWRMRSMVFIPSICSLRLP